MSWSIVCFRSWRSSHTSLSWPDWPIMFLWPSDSPSLWIHNTSRDACFLVDQTEHTLKAMKRCRWIDHPKINIHTLVWGWVNDDRIISECLKCWETPNISLYESIYDQSNSSDTLFYASPLCTVPVIWVYRSVDITHAWGQLCLFFDTLLFFFMTAPKSFWKYILIKG